MKKEEEYESIKILFVMDGWMPYFFHEYIFFPQEAHLNILHATWHKITLLHPEFTFFIQTLIPIFGFGKYYARNSGFGGI